MAIDADARPMTDDDAALDDESRPTEADADADAGADPTVDGAAIHPSAGLRPTLTAGLMALVAVGGVAGWLGFGAYQSHSVQREHDAYLQAARQAAINLTTIGYADTESDVSRILNSSTGLFHDDFQKRAPDFVQVVKEAQSKSQGTVTAAGIESIDGDQSHVLVAVSVKTATPADADPPPRGWRMRISLQKSNDGPKVSNVEFVP
jgi:Mce-associated membrane protein